MIVSRLLLGGIMLTGGIMHFLSDPTELYKSEIITAIFRTHYLWELIGAIEIFCGIGVLLRRYMPLLLVVLAPISIMILNYHLFEFGKFNFRPDGFLTAVIIVIAHLYLAWCYRKYYQALFTSKDEIFNN